MVACPYQILPFTDHQMVFHIDAKLFIVHIVYDRAHISGCAVSGCQADPFRLYRLVQFRNILCPHQCKQILRLRGKMEILRQLSFLQAVVNGSPGKQFSFMQ